MATFDAIIDVTITKGASSTLDLFNGARVWGKKVYNFAPYEQGGYCAEGTWLQFPQTKANKAKANKNDRTLTVGQNWYEVGKPVLVVVKLGKEVSGHLYAFVMLPLDLNKTNNVLCFGSASSKIPPGLRSITNTLHDSVNDVTITVEMKIVNASQPIYIEYLCQDSNALSHADLVHQFPPSEDISKMPVGKSPIYWIMAVLFNHNLVGLSRVQTGQGQPKISAPTDFRILPIGKLMPGQESAPPNDGHVSIRIARKIVFQYRPKKADGSYGKEEELMILLPPDGWDFLLTAPGGIASLVQKSSGAIAFLDKAANQILESNNPYVADFLDYQATTMEIAAKTLKLLAMAVRNSPKAQEVIKKGKYKKPDIWDESQRMDDDDEDEW